MHDQIGPYQILREIGSGGMGVVYLAHDARLDRDVAIKSLPEDLAQDPVRLERFEREAKAMASLNHPNVAGIHGVEEQGGSRYLVLEFVDGETLADRLDRGPLPVDEAIELATQIATGIESAHDAGVIHRDLKPANIMITSEGIAKVLDFGLARTDDGQSSTGIDFNAQTIPQSSPTIAGVILGTAAYMSPEQARGRRVDKRTDIWAFGVLLYEMLAGSNPFKGETATDSIGAVIHKDIDLSRLPSQTPSNVHHVLTRCLERDKNKRFRDIGDVRIDLEHSSGESIAAVNTARRSPLALIALAAVIFAIAGAGAMWLLKPSPKPVLMNLAIPVADRFESIDQIALSPDGDTIAIIAKEYPADNKVSLYSVYVRGWSDQNFRKLQDTERSSNTKASRFRMAFSPNGEHVLIEIVDEVRPISEVRSIPIAGGPSTKLFEILQNGQFSERFCYLSDDAIAVVSQDGTKIYRISTSGGTPEVIANLPGTDDLRMGAIIRPAPGSQTLIAQLWNTKMDQTGLYRVDLETEKMDLLLDDAYDATILSNGHIIFKRDDDVWIAPFSIDKVEVTGPAKGVLSGISKFVIEPTGRCAIYLAQDMSKDRITVVATDSSGRPANTLVDVPGSAGNWSKITLSPDGQKLLFNYRNQNTSSLWVRDMTSGLTRPFSNEVDRLYDSNWTPDGRIAYFQVSPPQIMVKDSDPGAIPERLLPSEHVISGEHLSFSPHGRHVLTSTAVEQSEPGIYLFDVGDGESGRPFYATPSSEGDANFSPDGRWVAYNANGSGRQEIYLRPFDAVNPESTPIYPVTTLGGQSPQWSPDGRTLYYSGIDADENTLFAVTIETEPELIISERDTISTDMAGVADFIPMPDGSFIMLKSTGNAVDQVPDLRVILNWESE
jgi:serine/threonine protein kinase/Tol biopolymer transport system component